MDTNIPMYLHTQKILKGSFIFYEFKFYKCLKKLLLILYFIYCYQGCEFFD